MKTNARRTRKVKNSQARTGHQRGMGGPLWDVTFFPLVPPGSLLGPFAHERPPSVQGLSDRPPLRPPYPPDPPPYPNP